MNPLKVAEGAKAMQAIKTGTSGPDSIVTPNVTTVTCKARGDTPAPHVLRTDIWGNAQDAGVLTKHTGVFPCADTLLSKAEGKGGEFVMRKCMPFSSQQKIIKGKSGDEGES